MAKEKPKSHTENSPQEMMKRLFAVVHLIVQTDSYQNIVQKQRGKHSKTQN